MKKSYFPGLDALRFFAACGIIIHHIEQIKEFFGVPFVPVWENNVVMELGKKGVIFFLVLSGFLVTRNLLIDIKTDNFNSKRFYWRRFLRIWPLYLLIVFWAFFIFPRLIPLVIVTKSLSDNFPIKFSMFFLMVPNVALIVFPPVWALSQTWVVGVEEQFYLFWPWLVRKFEDHLVAVSLIILLGKRLIEATVHAGFLASFLYGPYGFYIEAIIIGALGAHVLVHNSRSVLSFVFFKATQIIAYALIIFFVSPYKIYLFFLPAYHYFYDGMVSYGIPICMTILILNVALNEKSLIKLHYPFLDYLGKISYGIYMFHVSVIFFVLQLLTNLNLKNNLILFNVILYLGVIVLTITVSHVSYRYFELLFLKKKNKF